MSNLGVSPASNACPGRVWSPPTNYVTGDQVCWNQRRYRAVAASNHVRPGTSPATWQDIGGC